MLFKYIFVTIIIGLAEIFEQTIAVRCYQCAETVHAYKSGNAASCGLFPEAVFDCIGCVRYEGKLKIPYRLPKSFLKLAIEAFDKDQMTDPGLDEEVVIRSCWRFDRHVINPLANYHQIAFSNNDLMRKMELGNQDTIRQLGLDVKGKLKFCRSDRCNF